MNNKEKIETCNQHMCNEEVDNPYAGFNREVKRYAIKHKITAWKAFEKIYRKEKQRRN